MNRLYLIRHGENVANLTLEFSHRKVDYSLTDKGRMQAAQTAAYFQNLRVDEIYSSPLKRALETAQPIAALKDLPVTTVEGFREVNVGDLEGQKPTAALWAQHNAIIDGWRDGRPDLRFPGGEDLHILLDRLRAGLAQVLEGKDERNIVIVGHGGLLFFTLHNLCSGVTEASLEGGIANCSISQVDAEVKDGQLTARLVSFGSVDHLNGEAAQLVSGLMDTSTAGKDQE